jgi:pyruvate dehydrogenase E2 component (dihydrolipoamide acetyltransferase)
VIEVGKALVTIDVDPGAGSTEADGATAAPSEGEAPKRTAVLVGYGVDTEETPATRSRSRRSTATAGNGAPDDAGPVRATPPVRKLAKELGVDLASVTPTGPDGRVSREDVQAAAGAGAARVKVADDRVLSGQRIPVRGPRRLIAEKMSRSWREIPHVTTFLTVDATHVLAFRDDIEKETGTRVSPLAIVVRALAETCHLHPMLNASFDAEAHEIVTHGDVNVGIATDTERGLLVPVVRDADSKGIREIAATAADLVEQARTGTIEPGAFAGGTITVTNVGTFGSEFGTPIINHPEGAILALGVIEPRALVVDGEVVARPAVTVSLSFDHRLLDGAEAGRALRAFADLLESPFRLGALPR